MTKAEFELCTALWDHCRDEEELLSLYEHVREEGVAFDELISRLIDRGYVFSMGHLQVSGPEILELSQKGLEACCRTVWGAVSSGTKEKEN